MLASLLRTDQPLARQSRAYVNAKVARRRLEFEQKTYPRASTQEPNRLPRRGRRGGWMQEPSRGVARLDGENSAQRAWWQEHAGELDKKFVSKIQNAEASAFAATGGQGLNQAKVAGGPAFQELLDQHLAELQSLKVKMPGADDLRIPHIRRLAKMPKPNPVHEATVSIPPIQAPEQPEDPPFLNESLQRRQQHRRGRFLRSRQPEVSASHQPSIAPKAFALSSRKVAWMEDTSDESSSSDEEQDVHQQQVGRRSSRLRSPNTTETELPTVASNQASMMPMEPLRTTSLGDLWSAYGASWVEHNRCVVPSAFPVPVEIEELAGGTLSAYHQTRSSSSLFDVSFKVGVRVTGPDREFVADQFLTCNLRAMRTGDVQYACVLDSKGLILDDAFVFLTDESVEILMSGHFAQQVLDYLSQYIVYVRRSGADVTFNPSPMSSVLALQGPKSCEALVQAFRHLTSDHFHVTLPDSQAVALSPSVIEAMPYMSFLSFRNMQLQGQPLAFVLRVGTTGEDGFEILSPPGPFITELAQALLAAQPIVRPAGLYCLDMLRMEAGLARVGSDIPSGKVTPVRASLSWILDQSKMRNHLMFGWKNLFFQLAKGPKFRRVGLLLDGPAHAGCRLLSNPHRQPIGEITSTAWSPALQSRLAMAYIRPEYARSGKNILVTVPYNLPTHKMVKRAIVRWTRSGPLRSAYRRLTAACVVSLPFVPHCYPEPSRQRRTSARVRTFGGDSESVSPVSSFYKTRVWQLE